MSWTCDPFGWSLFFRDREDHTGNKQCFRAAGESLPPISHVADKMVKQLESSIGVCVCVGWDT